MARVYHRPIGLFFLPALPQEADSIRDFRRMGGTAVRSLSSALRFEITLAVERREEALELASDLEQPPSRLPDRWSLSDDPDGVAHDLRERLQVTVDEQVGWQTKYDGFNSWRASIECEGGLVFQTRATARLRADPSEARGFSIADQPFPVIVVNGSDRPTARSSTLIHELTHIALKNGGLCDLHYAASPRSNIDRTEVFCNRVAGSALLPTDALLRGDVVTSSTVVSQERPRGAQSAEDPRSVSPPRRALRRHR
jgi:hypothetical protein